MSNSDWPEHGQPSGAAGDGAPLPPPAPGTSAPGAATSAPAAAWPTTTAEPGGDVLASGGGSRGSRGRVVVLAIAALVVVLVGVGGIVAAKMLGGGGAQPETALPANAFAFVKVDLDPSAGQKIDAFRFLNKFPALGGKLDADEDLTRKLFDSIKSDGGLKGVDYDADIKPWLGKRVGVALLPPAGGKQEPFPVIALQVTDAGKAEQGLAKIHKSDPEADFGYVVHGDYALIAQTTAIAGDAAKRAEQSPLSADKGYSGDLEALGDSGVAAAWMDLAGLGDLVRASGDTPPQVQGMLEKGFKGRFATVVRFDGPNLEMVGRAVGADNGVEAAGPVKGHLGDLPSTTVAALSVNHGDRYVDQMFAQLKTMLGAEGDQLDQGIAAIEGQTGLKLPEDLKTLFGSNLVVALDDKELSDNPHFGARAVTDPVKADDVLGKIEKALAAFGLPEVAIPRDETSDGYVLASTPDYVKTLKAGGKLGQSSRFTDAVPGADKAGVAAYFDIATLVDHHAKELGASAKDVANLKPLAAAGMTVTAEKNGEASFVVRLTTR